MAAAADFRLIVAGEDFSAAARPRLISLTLSEKRGGEADQLDLVLSDHDGRLAIPRHGAEIELALGWRGRPLVEKGRFKVDETSHAGAPDQITIRARSADFTADLRTRREKSWADTTLGDVLGEIADRHALTQRIDPDLAETAIEVLQQSRESDSAFLKRLGDRYDAVATIKQGALIFAPIGAGRTAGGQALPSLTITRDSGDRHNWSIRDREGAYTGVTASWRSNAEATRNTELAGAEGKVKALKTVYASKADALRAANTALKRAARAAGELSIDLALGRPDLYPEQRASVVGFKPEIDAGEWLLAEVSHSLTGDGGLTTHLQMETAP